MAVEQGGGGRKKWAKLCSFSRKLDIYTAIFELIRENAIFCSKNCKGSLIKLFKIYIFVPFLPRVPNVFQ